MGANLGEALEHLLDQAAPRTSSQAPRFGQEIKPGKDLRQVLEVCRRRPTPDGRVFVEDKAVRQKLKNVCNPLELGQMSETHFVLGNSWKNHFNRLLAGSEQPHPTADLQRWMDKPEERGCPWSNLLILVYADQTNRSFVRYGWQLHADPGRPAQRAGAPGAGPPGPQGLGGGGEPGGGHPGLAVSKLLNASNLAALASKVGEVVKEYRPDCDGLPDRLHLVLRDLGVPRRRPPRRIGSGRRGVVLASCDGKEPTKLVGAIAQAKLETNATTMGRSLKSAKGVLECLRATRGMSAAVSAIRGERAGDAAKLIKAVVTWVETDEHALAGGLASRVSRPRAGRSSCSRPRRHPRRRLRHPRPQEDLEAGRSDRKERLTSGDWSKTSEELLQKTGGSPATGSPSSGRSRRSRNERRALSPQLRSIVEEKWERDEDALAVGLHVAAPWAGPDEVELDSGKARVVGPTRSSGCGRRCGTPRRRRAGSSC